MTSSGTEIASWRIAGRSTVGRLSAYARLGKFALFEHWLGVVLAWSLVASDRVTSGSTVAALAAFLVALMLINAAMLSFDDVQGHRDGLDRANYDPSQALRSVQLKPLVLRELTEREALVFARTAAAVGVAGILAAFLLAPAPPLWLLGVVVGGALMATQYAYGLKLSYRGAAEPTIVVLGAGTVAVPYMLVTGELTATVLVQSALVGGWILQISALANTADAQGDRGSGRMTMAARLSASANALFILALFATVWALTLGGIATGVLSPWLLVALVPCWAVQVAQLVTGLVREQWLRAYALGRWAFALGLLALILTNLS